MAQVTVYDLDNQPHQKESVDATECIRQLGWTMNPKPEPEVKAPAADPDPKAKK
jgi:hypothetical protein